MEARSDQMKIAEILFILEAWLHYWLINKITRNIFAAQSDCPGVPLQDSGSLNPAFAPWWLDDCKCLIWLFKSQYQLIVAANIVMAIEIRFTVQSECEKKARKCFLDYLQREEQSVMSSETTVA